MDSLELDGVYWLPATPTHQVAGRLSFDSSDGGYLSLIGTLEDLSTLGGPTPHHSIIHGVAERRLVTLLNCYQAGFNMSAPGITTERLRVGVILTGHLFDSEEEIVFHQLILELENLEHWVRRSGLSHSTIEQDELVSVHAAVTIPSPEVSQGEDEDIALRFTYHSGGDGITNLTLDSRCYLEIVTASPRGLGPILDDVGALQRLLTLCLGKAFPVRSVALLSEDIEWEVGDGRYAKVDIRLFASLKAPDRLPTQPVELHEMLVTYRQLGGIGGVRNWLAVSRRYAAVVNSLLSIRYAWLYAENKFQNVVSAAETLHRMRLPNFVRPRDDYAKIVQRILTTVPTEHHALVEGQVRYGNEPRLHKRLTDLARLVRRPFRSAVYRDEKAWAYVIAGIRNRLAHHDEDQVMEFDGGDLHYLSESVFLMTTLCLFADMGVEQVVLESVAENPNVKFVRERLDDVVPRLAALLRS